MIQDDATSPDPLLRRLVALRRDLHSHPELGFAEHRTQGVVRDWLCEFGYAPRDCAGTGLVADLHPSAVSGPTIALRADLDALPMDEHTALPHRSQYAGVAHKCGHDGHTAILCGVAARLAARRGELPGNVRLLFQPDEEGTRGGGAEVMLREGALDGVDEVYGLHNWPGFPKGHVRVVPGVTMADVQTLRIVLRGRGGHGSQPQTCRDPIAAGAQLVSALQTIVSRNVGHRGSVVLSICAFRAGTTTNVIPDSAELLGTLRTFDDAVRDVVVRRIREIVDGVALAMSVEAELEIGVGYPALHNDAQCVARVERAARAVLGEARVDAAGLPLGASEDFAFFARARPSAYFFLGAGAADGSTPSCHHGDYDFDDELLEPAMRILLRLVDDRFGITRS